MPSNLDKYKKDLSRLIDEGVEIILNLAGEKKAKGKKKKKMTFHTHYEGWYSEARAVVKQLLPDRLADFDDLYKRDKRKEITPENYGLRDYFIGLSVTRAGKPTFDIKGVALAKLQQQFLILKAAETRFESSLFDIRKMVQADLFDNELDASRELLKNKFLRAAGVVAGVVLERHLDEVCVNHNIVIRKKKTTISDYNDALKKAGILEISDWRFIQRLGDLRNLCSHHKKRQPKETEVEELIDGVEKITKTLA